MHWQGFEEGGCNLRLIVNQSPRQGNSAMADFSRTFLHCCIIWGTHSRVTCSGLGDGICGSDELPGKSDTRPWLLAAVFGFVHGSSFQLVCGDTFFHSPYSFASTSSLPLTKNHHRLQLDISLNFFFYSLDELLLFLYPLNFYSSHNLIGINLSVWTFINRVMHEHYN